MFSDLSETSDTDDSCPFRSDCAECAESTLARSDTADADESCLASISPPNVITRSGNVSSGCSKIKGDTFDLERLGKDVGVFISEVRTNFGDVAASARDSCGEVFCAMGVGGT